MPHTRKKVFYPRWLPFSSKLFLNVGNTSTKIQRESEKAIQKADFELKVSQRVSFLKKCNA